MPAFTELVAESIRDAKDSCLGGKAARLRQLQAAGFRVPEFVVSPSDLGAAVDQLGTPLAVRSSASVEDGTNVSFAGQFESFLNLHTLEEIEQAIRHCHASVTAPPVLNYCRKHGIDAGQIRMNVILQRMIDPELAGVVFTVNPATGEEQIVIEACTELAHKLLAGHQQALPGDHPLLQQHRDEIEGTARQIQRHYGAPQDIEFAVENGTLFVLQSRPITRISFSANVGEWTNADFRDGGVSSTVCTPLMWSLYEFVWDHSLKGCLRELKLFQNDFLAGRMFFGRPYWNLGALKACLATLPGFVERDFDDDLSLQITYSGPGRCTPFTLSTVLRAAPTLLSISRFFRRQQHDAEQLLTSGFDALMRRYEVEPLPDAVEETFHELIERDYLAVESTYFRTIFAASLAKLDLLSSFPDADYGALVAALPPLRHMAPVRAVQSLSAPTDEQLNEIVQTYRHHCRLGLDVKHPRWDEDHQFVRQMLAELPCSGGDDPREAYLAARSAALSQLPRWKQGRFNRKLDRLRNFVWLREELRDLSSRMYHLIRRYVLRLADDRFLGEDVFFCTFQQIIADDRSQIEQGREVYESYRHFKAPNEIGSRYRLEPSSPAAGLMGLPASPGSVTATAYVAQTVAEAAEMPTGHILVCPFTDPGWTPVLDRAVGVVTETGGLLSHAAIICREYGVPAVLGVADATARIRHGDMITIHGGDGRVEVPTPTLPTETTT